MQLILQEDKILVIKCNYCYRYLFRQGSGLLHYTDVLYQVFEVLTKSTEGVPHDCVLASSYQHLAEMCCKDKSNHKERNIVSKFIRYLASSGILRRGYGLFWLNPVFKFPI